MKLNKQINKSANSQISKGMSLLEILVVVSIFAILGIITTRAIILTLQGSQKSESLVKVRENLDYSLGVIERQLRNANSITECPNPDPSIINYQDESGVTTSFSCVDTGGDDSYVASGSARLTNDNVVIVSCAFSCTLGTSANPSSVMVNLEARDTGPVGAQRSIVTATTQIFLRNY
jgi:prepilin-type N-terminal cleavage/methylation domain-containing protein